MHLINMERCSQATIVRSSLHYRLPRHSIAERPRLHGGKLLTVLNSLYLINSFHLSSIRHKKISTFDAYRWVLNKNIKLILKNAFIDPGQLERMKDPPLPPPPKPKPKAAAVPTCTSVKPSDVVLQFVLVQDATYTFKGEYSKEFKKYTRISRI